MEHETRSLAPWRRVKRRWLSSLGVQSWLVSAGKSWLAEKARRVAIDLDPDGTLVNAAAQAESKERPIPGGAPPASLESMRSLITYMRDSLLHLDDVKDYSIIEKIDNDMYELWKELERKMQRHRRSEAKYQLKDMFRI